MATEDILPYVGRLFWNDQVIGTGFVVHASGLIATCYHVAAVGGTPPSAKTFVFKLLADDRPIRVEGTDKFDATQDVALLRAIDPLPDEAVPPRLVQSSAATAGTMFQIQGYGDMQGDDPRHAYTFSPAVGMIVGPARRDGVDLLQLSSKQILKGMSGSPIVVASLGGVVGIVSERYSVRPGGTWMRDTAWATRIERLVELATDRLATTSPTAASMTGDHEHVIQRSLTPPTSKLPNPVTRFIGRERELGDIHRLVTEHRLVTLAGAGGSGKTRLAIEVGREQLDRVRDGVWLVDLAPLADPDLVPRAIADVLGLRVEPNQPLLSVLEQYMRPRETLLILDNCEHLIDAVASLIDRLLTECQDLRVLVTSREPLNVDGESIYRVPTLSLPAMNHAHDLGVIAQADAVRFFVARARLVAADFTLRSENAELVAELCRRLDGIPLALELAAARLTTLSLEQVVERLADRFRLLTVGSRTALPRQQTLLATLDWSYGLLTDSERLLLRRLSVFAAGATLEALAAVCADDDLDEYDTLDLVTGLVNKSLAVPDERNGEARYRLLESIREYARDKLAASGERDRTSHRFAMWSVAFARDRNDDLRGTGQRRTLDRLETEHDNLRAALSWLLDHDPETAARLAVSLYWFWHVHSHVVEGKQWINRLLDTADAVSPTAQAKLLNGLAALATDQGDFADAVAYLERSLDLLGNEDPTERATVHLHMGTALREQGNYPASTDHWRKSMRLFQMQGDNWGIAYVLNGLGILAALEQRFEEACKTFDESLELRHTIDDEYGIAESLTNLGLALRHLGRFEQADAVLQECINRFESLQFATGVATAVNNRGWLALDQGDPQRAATQFHESLRLTQETGPLYLAAESLEGLASVAVVREEFERAACLLSAADRLYASIGVVATPDERAQFEGYLTEVKQHLAPDAFARLWESCRILQLADVIEDLIESDVT